MEEEIGRAQQDWFWIWRWIIQGRTPDGNAFSDGLWAEEHFDVLFLGLNTGGVVDH